MPLFYLRGAVYRVKFRRFEEPRTEVTKYLVCLQQGKLVERRDTFTAVVMNSCKDNKTPALFPWSVYASPADTQTEYGAIINCSEIHTIPKGDVLDLAYTLPSEIITKIDRALAWGIGIVSIEAAEAEARRRQQGKA